MKTISDAANWKFTFTITDVARFLGKSPVTLRHWERQGLIVFPRNNNGDRTVTVQEIRHLAKMAKSLGRITDQRLYMVEAAITMIEIIERENNLAKNSSSGSAGVRQNGSSPKARIGVGI